MDKTYRTNTGKHSVSIEDKIIILDGQSFPFEIIQISGQVYCAVIDEKPYKVYLNNSKSVFDIYINGIYFRLRLINKISEILENSERTDSNRKKEFNVKSPMPGLVTKILKKQGEPVLAGETVLFLEAMKMENAMKSAHDGILHEINVEENSNIEKGATLFVVK